MSFWCPFLATSFVIHLASIAVRWKSMTTLIPHTSARKDHTMQINRGKSASLHCESWLPATSQSQNHSIRRWNPTVTSKITSLLLPQKMLDRQILNHTDCTWEGDIKSGTCKRNQDNDKILCQTRQVRKWRLAGAERVGALLKSFSSWIPKAIRYRPENNKVQDIWSQ